MALTPAPIIQRVTYKDKNVFLDELNWGIGEGYLIFINKRIYDRRNNTFLEVDIKKEF